MPRSSPFLEQKLVERESRRRILRWLGLVVVIAVTPCFFIAAQRWRHARKSYYDTNVLVIEHPRSIFCGSDSGTKTTFDRDTENGICTIQCSVAGMPAALEEVDYSRTGEIVAYRRILTDPPTEEWELCLHDNQPTTRTRVYVGDSAGRVPTPSDVETMLAQARRFSQEHPLRHSFAAHLLCHFVRLDWWW